MGFVHVKNKNDYIKFIDDVKEKFESIEDWERFFGFNLKWDEETGELLETIFDYQGKIKYCPESFPAIIYYSFNDEKDRFGDFKFTVIDFITFEELGLE